MINYGPIVPTNFVWDIEQLQQSNLDPKVKELLIRLYQNIGLMALSLNLKDTGIYQTNEFVNGQSFFPNPANDSQTVAYPSQRTVLRKVINFGAMPNATTKSVAHGITCTVNTTFTRIYGATSDTSAPSYLPLPFVSSASSADCIQVTVDGTNVNVTTGANYSAYTISYIILEYMQN